ncbi:MAG TPA: MFS transporter, partial [Limnochordia bacterium]|nr:MFS transporter [Limnochordia bacterium]
MVPLLILGAVPFVMVLGNSMLIPLFPKMGEAMDLTPFQVGLLITAFSIPAGIVIPFAGAVSDHIGRRLIMAPALILYGAGGFVAGAAAILLTQPYGWVLAGRIIQGIGAGGTYQLAMALVGDLLQGGKRTQALGWLEAANGLGKVASPVVGSLVALIVWYAAFFTYGLLALPVAVAVWFLVPEGEERPKQSPGKYVKGLAAIFKARGVQLGACYAIGASALFLLFGLLSYVSDDLEARFGLTGLIIGLAVAVPVAASSVMAFTFGTLLQSRPKWARPTIL